MVKVGIIGATGYAGAEIVRLLSEHKDAEIIWYGSKSYTGESYAEIYRNAFHFTEEKCMPDDLTELSKRADVIFTATPQGYLCSVIDDEILKNSKIIDLSADFRIKDVSVYEKWYGITHKNPEFIKEAVYGLCEINREEIKGKRLIANPGCYTTCSILVAYPLIKEGLINPETLIIDASSGTSGAGRGAKLPNLFCEVNENMKPYGVTTHRHTPEIEKQLSYAADKEIKVTFTPHLAPMNRGILVTEYATLSEGVTAEKIRTAYEKHYGKEYFIRLLPEGVYPETKWVEGSNFIDIGFAIDERTNRAVMMGALDNLVKGAAGQAVQNMNILFGLDEKEGLEKMPIFP